VIEGDGAIGRAKMHDRTAPDVRCAVTNFGNLRTHPGMKVDEGG
jgi:hypothetical protein